MESAQSAAPIDDAHRGDSLSDDDVLLRRVPRYLRVAEGGTRPSSNAFDDSPDGSQMSVYVERILESISKTYLDVIEGFDDYGLVAFTVGIVRSLGWEVVLGGADEDDPLGPAHAGVHSPAKKTRPQRKILAMTCEKRVWP